MTLKENLRKSIENRLIKVDTDLGEFYVRRLNVGEMNAIIEREEVADKLENGLQGEAKFALRALDEQGKQIFNENDTDDLELIRDLPFSVRTQIDNAFFRANFGSMVKND